MNTLYHDIVIDLNHMGFPESVTVKQYDDQIPHVRVELRQNGAKYVIPSGTTLRMQGTKPDGTHFMYDVIRTDDGRVDCPLTNQILAAAGPILTEVCMTDTTGELTTFNFYILAQKAALSREEIESSDDYESIDKIREETQKYKEQAEAAKTAAEAAKEAATKSANTATQQAQTAQLEAQKVKQIVAGNEAYTKTESDLKYTVAPRKEASSANGELKLTDADEGLSYLALQGNSEQYTNTANKNLIDLNFATDGYSISSTGTLDKNEQYFTTGYIVVEPGEQYTFTRAISISNRQGCFYDKDKVFLQPWTGDAGLSKNTVTVPENVKYLRLFDYISHKEASQLEKGNTATDYVPGTVDTPSPEYPSEVRSVGDIPKDVNGVEIRNLLDEEVLAKYIPKTYDYEKIENIEIDPGTYKIKAEVTGKNKKMDLLLVEENLSSGNYVVFLTAGVAESVKTIKISNGKKGYIYVRVKVGEELPLQNFYDGIRTMLTNAAEIDEYRPYIGENNGLVKLESIGVNRADTGDGPISMASVNNIEVNTWTPRRIVLTQKNKANSFAYAKLNIEHGKNYTFYCKAKVEIIDGTATDRVTNIGFRRYPISGSIYGKVYLSQDGQYHDIYNETGIMSDDVSNMGFLFYLNETNASNGNVRMTIDDLMVVEGKKTLQEMQALKFQPYYQQITWIPLREPLRGIIANSSQLYSDRVDKDGNVTILVITRHIKDLKVNAVRPSYLYNDDNFFAITYISGQLNDPYDPVTGLGKFPNIDLTMYGMSNMFKAVGDEPKEGFNASRVYADPHYISIRYKYSRINMSSTNTDAEIKQAITQWVQEKDPILYLTLEKSSKFVDIYKYQIPAVYIETHDPETSVRCLNKVKPSDMTLDYKIAMSSLIKRLEALEEKTVQEV